MADVMHVTVHNTHAAHTLTLHVNGTALNIGPGLTLVETVSIPHGIDAIQWTTPIVRGEGVIPLAPHNALAMLGSNVQTAMKETSDGAKHLMVTYGPAMKVVVTADALGTRTPVTVDVQHPASSRAEVDGAHSAARVPRGTQRFIANGGESHGPVFAARRARAVCVYHDAVAWYIPLITGVHVIPDSGYVARVERAGDLANVNVSVSDVPVHHQPTTAMAVYLNN